VVLEVAFLLLVLSVGAFVVPVLAPRVGLPEAVGHIFFGIFVVVIGLVDMGHGGGHGSDAVGFGAELHLLAELGFILLMFGAGLEIDFAAIERGGKIGLLRGGAVALGVVVSCMILVALANDFRGPTEQLSAFYVVVLSATSIGLGVVVLRETGLSTKPVGQTILLVGAIGEFITLVAMTIYNVYKNVGLKAELGLEVGKLVLLFLVGGLFLRFLKAWTWWHPGFFVRVFARHDHSEVGVRAAVAACLSFVALAVFLRIDPVLGAFIAGAVARMVFRDVEVLEQKMSALSSGFFIPIFFIYVGMTFDVRQISLEGLTAALFLGALMVLARLVPCLLLVTDRNLGPREALAASFLLAAPLTLLVAIAKLGEQLGVLKAEESSTLVLLAILLSIVMPVGFKLLFRGGGPSVAHH
jgi:Kef-type K+ transport system membrane component KefB